jgi:hypothetical protein
MAVSEWLRIQELYLYRDEVCKLLLGCETDASVCSTIVQKDNRHLLTYTTQDARN